MLLILNLSLLICTSISFGLRFYVGIFFSYTLRVLNAAFIIQTYSVFNNVAIMLINNRLIHNTILSGCVKRNFNFSSEEVIVLI